MNYLILLVLFISCNPNDGSNCHRLALNNGYPEYTFDYNTGKCYGKNELKAELLSERTK